MSLFRSEFDCPQLGFLPGAQELLERPTAKEKILANAPIEPQVFSQSAPK